MDRNKKAVFIDAQALRNATLHRGIGRYTLKFAMNLAQIHRNLDVVLLFSNIGATGNTMQVVDLLENESSNLYFYIVDVFEESKILSSAQCNYSFNQKLFKMDIEELVVPSIFEHPLDVIPISPKAARKSAAILHDLIPLQFKNELLPTRVARRLYFSNLARMMEYPEILSVSNYSANIYRSVTRSKQRIHVVLGSGFYEQRPLEIYNFENRLGIVCVGAESPHKNLRGLIEAYGLLDSRVRDSNPLIIVGIKNEVYKKHLQKLARRNGCKIIIPDSVSDKQLELFYAKCRVVIVPSLEEGLSMPILEGWRMGAVGIGGRGTVLEEVIRSEACLFNPHDSIEMNQVIQKFLTNAEIWQEEQSKASVRLLDYSWSEVIRRAESFLGSSE